MTSRKQSFFCWSAISFFCAAWTAGLYAEDAFYDSSNESTAGASDILLPFVSLPLPGLGQWVQGHYGYGATYTTLSIASASYGLQASEKIRRRHQDPDLDEKGIAERKSLLGFQTYQSVGGFSLFHTFRTAAHKRQKLGQYAFLTATETPMDVALAPFRLSYMKRMTTWAPMLLGAVVNLWIARHPLPNWEADAFRREDAAFASAFSWNAGTHEEAVFRGWLMPVLREYWMNDAWANGTQASLFAAAHLPSTPTPIVQWALGYYFGGITQANQWHLGEAIFIHTWWDVMAFAAQYHMKKKDPTKPVASLHFPPLQISF